MTKKHEMYAFKQVKGKRGLKYRQTIMRDGSGRQLEIEHDGHDHLTLDLRSIKVSNGKKSNCRLGYWIFNSKEAVEFASILLYLVEEHMRDLDESPFYILTTKDKSKFVELNNDVNSREFGNNWVREDIGTAKKRLERRKSRSHLFGLMQRCVECCEDEDFIKFLIANLSMWADKADDDFARQKAEQAIAQHEGIPKALLN